MKGFADRRVGPATRDQTEELLLPLAQGAHGGCLGLRPAAQEHFEPIADGYLACALGFR
ncbi:MAG: hypothetical protein HYY04_07680 [Chloroflexi bacterium]|nr:hypothetical protein [Chloroflexota bacterium]